MYCCLPCNVNKYQVVRALVGVQSNWVEAKEHRHVRVRVIKKSGLVLGLTMNSKLDIRFDKAWKAYKFKKLAVGLSSPYLMTEGL